MNKNKINKELIKKVAISIANKHMNSCASITYVKDGTVRLKFPNGKDKSVGEIADNYAKYRLQYITSTSSPQFTALSLGPSALPKKQKINKKERRKLIED